jgi:hypothetical protein
MILLDDTYWEIRTTKEKGRGIYTKLEIEPGTVIGDYVGRVIKTAEEDTSDKDGLYLLYYHDYAAIYPEDIMAVGIHLANHSCAPNSWIYTYKGHTLFFALRKIHPGEEITISYQLSPSDFCKPCSHACHCGSEFCTGTMHLSPEAFSAWNTFNESEAKKTKRTPIRYGRILPRLKEYPSTINDDDIYTLYGAASMQPQIYNNENLPSVDVLRKRIRQTGRMLYFPKMQTLICGIKENHAVSKDIPSVAFL